MISKLIVEAIEQKKYKNDIKNRCSLCGIENASHFFKRKNVLSAYFTEYNYLKIKGSNYICNYCEKLLSNTYMDSPKGKRCGLRLYSFFVENKKFKVIDMKEKIKYLFDYNFKGSFLLCFSKTGQKHIFYKAILSDNNNSFYICTETNNIFFERNKYIKIYKIINSFFQQGITKDELRSCIISPKKINKYQLSFNDIIKIKKYKNNYCYELIIDCLIKEKKNDTND